MIIIKNKEQIQGIKNSCQKLSSLLAYLIPLVQPGIRTSMLDEVASEFLQRIGATSWFSGYNGYPATICVSVNEEVIHGIPGKKRLQDGDIVSLDCGINVNGYLSDAAITLPLGKISAKARELLTITQECLALGIQAVMPGQRVSDISRAIFSHASNFNFGIVHDFCGHGVGLEAHEEPAIPNYPGNKPNPRLLPGMIFAIEPMINLKSGEVEILDDGWTVVTKDRQISAHYEHTVLVTDTGAEVLTNWEMPPIHSY